MASHRLSFGPVVVTTALLSLAALGACGRSGLDDLDIYDTKSSGNVGGGGATSSSTFSGSTGGGGMTSSSVGPSTTVSSSSGPSTTSTSVSSSSGGCVDADGDGVFGAPCGDDCNDFNPQVFPGAPENCTDGSDNDCNGVADCNDPACQGGKDCGCDPKPESCNNGKDDDCDGIADCFDVDCVSKPECNMCAATEAGQCQDGEDDDCDGSIDCDDSDCFGDAKCQCQAQQEICDDGKDDDCDLLVDCADPNCKGIGPCACVPPGSPENCQNGVDDDCDGKVDCQDPDCIVSPACKMCTAEQCTNGLDDNCDGKIDCADPACAFDPACAPTPEICNNQLDDDHDGLIDCSDPDCANNPNCVLQQKNCLSPKLITGSGSYFGDTTGHVSETKGSCGGDAGEAVFYFTLNEPTQVILDSIGTSFDSTLYVRTGKCNSGKEIGCDDDSGGMWAAKLEFDILYPGTYYVFLDGYTVDPNGGANEGPFQLNVQFNANPKENCSDGKDNDGDHYVDCADPDCTNVGKCLNCNGGKPPKPEFGSAACTDGQDDDCDGTIDCADDDCSASDYYVTECCDGTDENGNGIPDDFNCRCASDADCPDGQMCYTHTAYACGIPCDQFFGDVCPFVASGSFCNAATHQCEF